MCARRLCTLLMQGKNLVYFDESSFQTVCGAHQTKCWAHKGEQINLPQWKPSHGKSAVTLFACIGRGFENNHVFMKADASNGENLTEFFKQV